VVRDLNGNGTIDSGREFFGDNTLLTRGPKAGQRSTSANAACLDQLPQTISTRRLKSGQALVSNTLYSGLFGVA